MTYDAARRVRHGAVLKAANGRRMRVLRKKIYSRWVIFFGLANNGEAVHAYHDKVNR